MDSWIRALAGGLLFWGFSSMSSGCVIPSVNDTVLQDPPVLLNRPPRIIESTVNPGHRCVCLDNQSSTGPKVQFNIGAVTDPDLCDTLELQWFIDYNVDTQESILPQPVIHIPVPAGNTEPIRTLTAQQGLLDLTQTIMQTALPPGVHIVEAVVADGDIQVTSQGRVSAPRNSFQDCFAPKVVQLPDGGQAQDQTYLAVYAWTLLVSPNCITNLHCLQ